MLRWLAIVPVFVACLSASWPPMASAREPAGTAEELFELEIRPVLTRTCFPCHGGKKTSGGLRVDSREALLKGGEAGTSIVPGRPEQSLLLRDPSRRRDAQDAPHQAAARGDNCGVHAVGQGGSALARSSGQKRSRSRVPCRSPLGVSTDQECETARGPDRMVESPDRPLPRGEVPYCRREARRGRRSADPAPARDLRPDRPAADARGDRDFPRRRVGPTPSHASSSGCWPRRTTASAGAGTGWTSSATPTRPATTPITRSPRPRATATTSSTRSTPTSRTTSSSASSSPATSWRDRALPGEAAEKIVATGFLALSRRYATAPYRALAPHARRHDRHDRPRLPRPDAALRPLPRSQVRPGHPATTTTPSTASSPARAFPMPARRNSSRRSSHARASCPWCRRIGPRPESKLSPGGSKSSNGADRLASGRVRGWPRSGARRRD